MTKITLQAVNKPFLFAALLAILAALIRTWDGEFGPLMIARESTLPESVVGFFYLTWYAVTIVFVLTSATFGYFGLSKGLPGTRTAGMVLGILFLAWSVTVAIVSSIFVWHPGTFIPMLVMLLIGVLGIIGARAELSLHGGRVAVSKSP
jgi:hypothetical protein